MAYEPDSTYVPSSACEPNLEVVPSSSSLLDSTPSVTFSKVDSDDENPPLPVLVPLPKGRKLVRCKWVYRTKYGPDGKVDKHKAILVAKGFS